MAQNPEPMIPSSGFGRAAYDAVLGGHGTAEGFKLANESPELHGLAFGAFDTARKVLSQVENLLGHDPTPPPEQPNDVTEMVTGATSMLTAVMRKLENVDFSQLKPALDAAEDVAQAAEPVVGRRR